MHIASIMSQQPYRCQAEASIQQVAQAMADGDFGACPVVNRDDKPIGIITDRDIAIRAVAAGKGPDTPVSAVMTSSCCSIAEDADSKEACDLMKHWQIRRVVVVDANGKLSGMVALADIALEEQSDQRIAESVGAVSKPKQSG